ncbi:MAG: metallophosphoesterase [Cyclobacteriaceae bacterium]|nr:metallophosphoesterase [Cyclobacteriaceae bacterium]
MGKMFMIAAVAAVLLLMDWYVSQAVKTLLFPLNAGWRKGLIALFWAISAISILGILTVSFTGVFSRDINRLIVTAVVLVYFSKLFGVLTLMIDDIYHAGQWVFQKIFSSGVEAPPAKPGISRSEFISKASLIAIAAPMATFGFGILSGAHNYRVHRRTIYLPNLPAAFDGIQIGQLSDIHSGSFFSRSGVKKGISLFMEQKPDIAFFTGDLVNDVAEEVKEYKDLYAKVKAPLGVFSTLGNHDYGDYRSWPDLQAKRKNLADLIRAQKEMGWDLLMNENRILKVEGEEIAILGVENWGAGRFSKYGDLAKAYAGTENKPVKLLLSHDPSHWDAQIRPQFGDIDVTFSGHTHGFQFGVEIGDFKWSPSQYIYKQWSDLHREDKQYLYVNRGFGFLGYPGRIGILPEITIIALKRG